MVLTTNCLGGLPLRASRFLAASSHAAMTRSRLHTYTAASGGQPSGGTLKYDRYSQAVSQWNSAYLYLRGRTSLPNILPGNIRMPNASCTTPQVSVPDAYLGLIKQPIACFVSTIHL